mmetsp:Transcript_223/g.565  ORF Transcript_223/g.565 Transcript_223/m.565 type:complete len:230 (-) Transcript_223:505-1194(-)
MIPVVSPVGPVFRLGHGVYPLDALIHHVPDEPPLHPRQCLVPDRLPIFVRVPVAVPHRVAVLAHDDGPGAAVAAHHPVLAGAGIHGTHHVRELCPSCPVEARPAPFVLYRPRGVHRAHERPRVFEASAPSRLVADAPRDHARVVPVPRHHPRRAGHDGVAPREGGDEGPHRSGPVCLEIGLVHHVHAVGIAEGVEGGVVGIVRRPHGVEVVTLQDSDIFLHGRDGDGLA